MIVEFDKSFVKSLDKIKDSVLYEKVELLILELERVQMVSEIKNTKKLKGYKSYYRIRIGDYRVGFDLINSGAIRLIIVARRKDIYRVFP
jgi:mRNA interferase RelE/StbE